LAAVVTGGDRKTIETIFADRRLDKLATLIADRFLDVPEPRHAVLATAAESARAVRIRITDPE
jgi:Actinobacteria/chloroflexi VLRF1 release factor